MYEFENPWITSFRNGLTEIKSYLITGRYELAARLAWIITLELNPRDPERENLKADLQKLADKPSRTAAEAAYTRLKTHLEDMGYLSPQSYELIAQIHPQDLTLEKGR